MGAVAVLPDGRVVTGGGDGRVLVWDPAEPGAGPVELGRHEDGVGAVAVLPDGRVITGGGDGRVLVWDPAEPGTGPVELGGHEEGVGAVAVLPDGRVVTGGGDGRVRLWDPGAAQRSPDDLGRHEGAVGAVAVLPDGRVVTCGGDSFGFGGRVLVWDLAQRGPVELGRREAGVWEVAVLPDGRVVSGGRSGRVLMWDPAQPGTGPVELGGHEGAVGAVAVLPDGRVVTGGGSRLGDGRVLVWDPAQPRRPGRARPPRGRGGRRWRCCRTGGWSPAAAASAAVGGCWCGTWRSRAPARSSSAATSGGVGAVAVLPDGRVVTGGRDGRVLVWDPARAGRRPGRARRPRGRGGRGRGAAGRAGGHRRPRRPGVAAECAEQLTRHSARMLRVRARYFPLPIWNSPLHRSRSGRNFMLGGRPSGTEHAWSPAMCG